METRAYSLELRGHKWKEMLLLILVLSVQPAADTITDTQLYVPSCLQVAMLVVDPRGDPGVDASLSQSAV